MSYITTIGYHDAYFEVEVVICTSSNAKTEAEKIGNEPFFHYATFYEDKLIIGKGDNTITIQKEEVHLYQFRVCRNGEHKEILSYEDYEKITWDEALEYFKLEYKNNTLPFPLESYYYGIYDETMTLFQD